VNDCASVVAERLQSVARASGPESGELAKAAEALKRGRFAIAYSHATQAREHLVEAKKEKSWQVSLRLGNRYPYPLNVTAILTADCGGVRRELYRGVPFESPGVSSRSFAFYLPSRPAALTISVSSWSGDLNVESLRVHNSREAVKVTGVVADHAQDAEACVGGPEASFVLRPWASESSVRLEFKPE
jgi:hypothetical protein